VFGKLAGEHAARYAKAHGGGSPNTNQVEASAAAALAPMDRRDGDGGEGPYQVQHELQDLMQDNVGIVRAESEMQEAVERIGGLKGRAERVSVQGNREYNPGWHTALDLPNLLTVAEAVARAALERQESRGAHFRADYEGKDDEWGKFNIVIKKTADGSMSVAREERVPVPGDLQAIVEEMK